MIKTAVIGLGPHGKRFLQCIAANPALTLTAVVDRDKEKLQALQVDPAVQRLNDLAALWQHQIDLLLIATNGPSHAPIAMEAMTKGVQYIVVCKPVATSLADARQMEKMARETRTRIAVDHGLRFDKTYRWISKKINEGDLGKLRTIYIQRPGIGLGCLGVHSFDLAAMLSGSEVDDVTAWIDDPILKNPRGDQFVDPGGLVIIHYKNGVKAVINQVEDGNGPMSVELNFTAARIYVDEKFRRMELVRKVTDATSGLKQLEKIENPQQFEVSHDTVTLMSAILEDLVSGENSLAPLTFGVQSLEVLVAAYTSHDRGHVPIPVPVNDPHVEKRFLPIT